MTKPGFFNQYPYHLDIMVSPEMEAKIGVKHISSVVYNARMEGDKVVATTTYEGKLYTVRSETFLEQSYWLLIASENTLEVIDEAIAKLEQSLEPEE